MIMAKSASLPRARSPNGQEWQKFDGSEVHYDGVFTGKCFIKMLLMNLIKYCHENSQFMLKTWHNWEVLQYKGII